MHRLSRKFQLIPTSRHLRLCECIPRSGPPRAPDGQKNANGSVWLRTALGQKLKSSMGAYVFRSAPNNGHRATTAACPSCANKRHDGKQIISLHADPGSRNGCNVSSNVLKFWLPPIKFVAT